MKAIIKKYSCKFTTTNATISVTTDNNCYYGYTIMIKQKNKKQRNIDNEELAVNGVQIFRYRE